MNPKDVKTVFKGLEINAMGYVLDTFNSTTKDGLRVLCKETTGHKANIVALRKNGLEVTLSELNGKFESNVYFYEVGSYNFYYSRSYDELKKVPKKYRATVDELMIKHKEFFI